MSDQLFPEDILNARQTVRGLALAAKAEADAENERDLADQVDALTADVWELLTYKLELPDYLLEDVAFEIDTHSPSRARLTWTMDDLEFRVYYQSSNNSNRRPHFEVRLTGPQNHGGSGWRTFGDMASLGRLLS